MENESMISKRMSASKNGILWVQWAGSVGTMWLMFVCGMTVGWTSPFIAQLTSENTKLRITSTEASWVASLLNLGRLIGSVPGSISVQYLGSKITLLIACIPLIVGWVCMIMADSVSWLYASRIFSGLSLGISFSTFPIYLGEIAEPAIRGGLVSLAIAGAPVGAFLGNVIGAYVSMPVFAYIGLGVTLLCILALSWIPESPHHLIRVNKIEAAKCSLKKYNPNMDVDIEIKSLEKFINASSSVSLMDKLREFNIPENRKAGFIIFIILSVSQMSGIHSILFYLETIMTSAHITVIPPATVVMLGALVGIFASLYAVYLADKLGRKNLLLVSTAGSALTLVILGLHFTLIGDGFHSVIMQWIVILSIFFYQAFIMGGISTIPNIILSELFAPNIKSLATLLASVTNGAISFFATKSYQPLLNILGESYLFALYSFLLIIVAIFTLLVVPETKGKSLQEIQNFLHKKI